MNRPTLAILIACLAGVAADTAPGAPDSSSDPNKTVPVLPALTENGIPGQRPGRSFYIKENAPPAAANDNLLPNGAFTGDTPLRGWITAFPDEAWYKDNAQYVKVVTEKTPSGKPAVMLDLAPGIAGNQGGKIESEPVKVIPGATYRVDVDCMTWDFGAKLHAEAWTTDPNPAQKRTIFRRAARGDLPPLIMCYRAQIPSPPGGAKSWSTAGREFTVPKMVRVAGKDQAPEFITVKAVAYAATMAAGKSYFSNFRLVRIK